MKKITLSVIFLMSATLLGCTPITNTRQALSDDSSTSIACKAATDQLKDGLPKNVTIALICALVMELYEFPSSVSTISTTPSDVALRLANKIKSVRKRKKITQKQLAGRSNVSYATLRKFEKTGQISLESFIKLTMELGLIQEINNLFSEPVYTSIEEVINASKYL